MSPLEKTEKPAADRVLSFCGLLRWNSSSTSLPSSRRSIAKSSLNCAAIAVGHCPAAPTATLADPFHQPRVPVRKIHNHADRSADQFRGPGSQPLRLPVVSVPPADECVPRSRFSANEPTERVKTETRMPMMTTTTMISRSEKPHCPRGSRSCPEAASDLATAGGLNRTLFSSPVANVGVEAFSAFASVATKRPQVVVPLLRPGERY